MKLLSKVAAVCTTVVVAAAMAVGGVSTASAIGGHDECVPKDAWTEVITPGTPGTPAVDAKDAVYETKVITEAGWQRYSWIGGPWGSDTAPAFPGVATDWQANVAGDPHDIGVAGAYFQSHGNSGNGDWFYLEAVPAVTEQVLVSEAVAAVPAVPPVEAVTKDHPAVVCEPDEEDPTPILPTCTTITGAVVLSDEAYVGDALTLVTTEAEQGYWLTPFVGNLADIGTQLEVVADPASEVGLWIYVDGHGWIVYEEGVYGGNLWSKTAFAGIPAGSGYAASAPIEDYIALYGDLPAEAWLLYGSSEAGTTAVSSVTVGCTIYTFEHDEPVVVPEQPEPVVTVVEKSVVDCDAKTVETTTTTTTTTTVYDEESNTWIAGEDVVEVTTAEREATAEECPVVIPPVVEEPTPPVVEEPVVATPIVPVAKVMSQLPFTGADTDPMLPLGALGLLLAGAATLVGRKVFAQR